VIPHSFIPAVEKGCLEAMQHGVVAGYPVKGVRVPLHDGSYHTVDSSEMAFKMAGSIAMKRGAGAGRRRCCSSRSCSSRSRARGRRRRRHRRPQLAPRAPAGMEPVGGMTEVKAEVPMAEMLTYAPDLRSLTGGQGDYTMEFLRYEEVPAHLAQKVVARPREEEASLTA
jgi:elongation factor G